MQEGIRNFIMLARNHGCIWMQVRARTSLFVQLQTGEPDLESADACFAWPIWLSQPGQFQHVTT